MSKNSETLFAAACKVIPGGVNSPVRAFKSVGGTPLFFRRGEGSRLYDQDDRAYIDYVGSWGPKILGHAHPAVVAAVQQAAARGLSFGAPTEQETEMAQVLCRLVPSMQKVRMVNSGTEATMSAIRLARGFTGRDKLIKFEGCYHGHSDGLLVKAGSGALTLGVPTSPGVPASVAEHTLTVEYNNAAEVETTFEAWPEQIAAVIVEPVAGNMNCVPPVAGFLEALRESCDRHGAVLIFDEVMTGFRVGLGCAQGRFGITPDLTTLGKIVGGGMPVGAFGGRADIMDKLAPDGPVYQAGTLSGNPVAMAAGLATLAEIVKPGFYEQLEKRTTSLLLGLEQAADRHGVAFTTQQCGAMFGLFFTSEGVISSFSQAVFCDSAAFNRFFHGMLERGINLAPSAFETGFMSAAHSEADIEATITAADSVFVDIGQEPVRA